MQIPGLELVTSNSGRGTPASRCSLIWRRAWTAPRPTCRPPSTRPPDKLPVGSAQPADVHQNQSERSADHVRRADQRHGDRRPALRLRQHAGGRAHQHSCRASARWRCSARSRRCASRPIPRRWPAATSPWTIWPRRSRTAPATPGRANSTASTAHSCCSRRASSTTADRLRQSDRRPAATARRFI